MNVQNDRSYLPSLVKALIPPQKHPKRPVTHMVNMALGRQKKHVRSLIYITKSLWDVPKDMYNKKLSRSHQAPCQRWREGMLR